MIHGCTSITGYFCVGNECLLLDGGVLPENVYHPAEKHACYGGMFGLVRVDSDGISPVDYIF